MNKTRSKWSNDAVIWNIFGKSFKWINHHTVNRILSHFPSETRAKDNGDGLRILRATAKDPTEAWGHLRQCSRPLRWVCWSPNRAAGMGAPFEIVDISYWRRKIFQINGLDCITRWFRYDYLAFLTSSKKGKMTTFWSKQGNHTCLCKPTDAIATKNQTLHWFGYLFCLWWTWKVTTFHPFLCKSNEYFSES